ncbi:type II toxin-antitoxin system YoeB family toxin [Kamptonema animale CS-326]|jgi:toxin YoeB|uniref:type II toxin-antitoxin system RelE/ParE family toxin n=1 Tax=Kamptonema animale TaxID=92934 RepID=UPI00232AD679|nr:type II toxin-antitoxin system YoeB family toxin [Kamptonema animale]MDB9511530.1 type II toxin-antitoxin system YoeB family toxin [Kamptonema animale CS-326]
MTDYQILFSKTAQKDIELLAVAQKAKLQTILQQVIANNPYLGKSLKGTLEGLYSYRLNRKDRIVYEIIEADKVVFVIRARTHYGD